MSEHYPLVVEPFRDRPFFLKQGRACDAWTWWKRLPFLSLAWLLSWTEAR